MTQCGTSYIRFDPLNRVCENKKYTEKNGITTWTVIGGLSFYVGSRKDECWVCVPNGYRVVGAYVHKFFRNWIKPCSKYGQSVIIHNYLCSTAKIRVGGTKITISRRIANKIFLEAMEVLGVPLVERYILYLSACLKSNEDEISNNKI